MGRADLVLKTDLLTGDSLAEMASRAVELGTADADRMVDTYRGRLRAASTLLQKAVS
jgi:hypothetical protein